MAKKRKKKKIYIYICRSLEEQPQNLLWELKHYAKLSIPPWTTYNCWLFSFLRRAWFLPVDARGIKIFLDQDTCRPGANPPGVDSVAVVTVGPRETCCWTLTWDRLCPPCAKSLSHVQLFVALWTLAHQAPLSMGFPREEYWRGLRTLLQGIFPTQGSDSCLLHLLPWQVGSLQLAEINSEYSLEGLMLKFQYFGHLMWRADTLEKTLMLGKIEGRRRKGRQRMR